MIFRLILPTPRRTRFRLSRFYFRAFQTGDAFTRGFAPGDPLHAESIARDRVTS